MSRSEQVSREASCPSVPGRVHFAPSRQMSIWMVRVRTRMRCLLPKGRVARRSLRFRYNFWIPRNGDWRRAVVSARGKHHCPGSTVHLVCRLDCGRVTIRLDASRSFLTILHWCKHSAKDAQHIFLRCFQSRVVSLRSVSGPVLSYRSGGYLQNFIIPTREVVFLTVIVCCSHLLLDMVSQSQMSQAFCRWRRVSREQQLDSQFVFNQCRGNWSVSDMRPVSVAAHSRSCANALLRP